MKNARKYQKNTIFAAIINSIYTINRKPIAYIYSNSKERNNGCI